MHPPTRNPFDTRPPGNPDTAKFLAALGDPEAAASYRQVMGEDATSSTTDDQAQDLTPEELARLQAIQDREREHERELAALKADYLAWAREFNLGDDEPEAWIDKTFTFNPDGTVEVDDDLDLSHKSLTRLPPALIRVKGNLNLGSNYLTSPEGLPKVIHGDLNLSRTLLNSLDELQGKKIGGDLYLDLVRAKFIPEGIDLGGHMVVYGVLKHDAIRKGYTVRRD